MSVAQRLRDLVNGTIRHEDLEDDERIAMHRLINAAGDTDLWKRRAELHGYGAAGIPSKGEPAT
jgi:hypothetical protein